MKKSKTLILLGVIFLIACSRNSSKSKAELAFSKSSIKDFAAVYQEDGRPTVELLSNLYGDEAIIEFEFKFEDKVCEINGWTNAKCKDFFDFKKRPMNQRPSLYLMWLARRFPLNVGEVQETLIEEVVEDKGVPILPYEIIKIKTKNGARASFLRSVNTNSASVYGKIVLYEFDGEKIDDIFSKEIEKPSELVRDIATSISK